MARCLWVRPWSLSLFLSHIHAHTHAHILIYVYTYTNRYTHTLIYIYIYMCVCVCVHKEKNEIININSCTHLFTRTYLKTYGGKGLYTHFIRICRTDVFKCAFREFCGLTLLSTICESSASNSVWIAEIMYNWRKKKNRKIEKSKTYR